MRWPLGALGRALRGTLMRASGARTFARLRDLRSSRTGTATRDPEGKLEPTTWPVRVVTLAGAEAGTSSSAASAAAQSRGRGAFDRIDTPLSWRTPRRAGLGAPVL